MDDSGGVKLNTLNYDAREQAVVFSFQGAQGDAPVILSGRVPLVMPDEADARQIAKDTVKQLLLEAIDAL